MSKPLHTALCLFFCPDGGFRVQTSGPACGFCMVRTERNKPPHAAGEKVPADLHQGWDR